jgi:drug/metabolite transporter (DMT)-like permease
MKKFKTALKYFAAFLLGLILALLSEDSIHKLARQLYASLTYNKISFHLPKLDFYLPSVPFMISLGLYNVVLLYLFARQTSKQRLINTFLTIIFLVSTMVLYCYFDANIKLIECTACNDGKRELYYSDIHYTKISIVTLLTSLIPFMWTEIRIQRRTRRKHLFKASL